MITVIAAIAANNCIGVNGGLPWHIPEDMARFKALTTGRTVLMGRKTWESLPPKYRPLPDRTNIVVTRQERYDVPAGVAVHASVDAALDAHRDDDLSVIGGAEVYAVAMDHANRLHITHVHHEVMGDAFFPEIDPDVWTEIEREDHDGFSFVTYERHTRQGRVSG